MSFKLRIESLWSKPKKPNKAQGPVIVSSWRRMIQELEEEGFTITQVSDLTGVPRRTVQRWFNGTEEMPGYALFCKVLYLYCFYKMRERDKKNSYPKTGEK
jgi:transcriptional regulator with XRE-family HTH domain